MTARRSGERGDTFISTSRSGERRADAHHPDGGWVARLGSNRDKLASYSIAKYGPQTGNDWQWFPDAGNGVSQATGGQIAGNDPNDANLPAGSELSAGLGPTPGRQTGASAANGGLALLHPGQRAEHLALDPPRRPSGRRDDGRDPRTRSSTTQPDQASRPRRAGRRARRMGLERLSLQRLRPAVRQPPRVEHTSRPERPRWQPTTCPGCSTQLEQTQRRPAT